MKQINPEMFCLRSMFCTTLVLRPFRVVKIFDENKVRVV